MKNQQKGKSLVGIYGGAFDPVHDSHIQIMRLAIRELNLTRLVVVPSGHAPHKTTQTSFEKRVEMLRLATADMPEVVIDTIESLVKTTAYSAMILPLLAQKYGKIIHIIGGDSLIDMPTWYCPERVMRFPHAVIPRGEITPKFEDALLYAITNWSANVQVIRNACAPIASSEIRCGYRIGIYPQTKPPVPAPVASYIAQHRLYSEYANIVDWLKEWLGESRFAHTQQVALMALRLNRQLHLPEEQVIQAALLHDCAKGLNFVDPHIPQECRQEEVVHAFNGACIAQKQFNIYNVEVLDAIRYHTTGRAEMTPLEKLIYTADYCEETRRHPGAETARQIALEDFEKGFLWVVRESYRYLIENVPKESRCPLSEECYRYYYSEGENK